MCGKCLYQARVLAVGQPCSITHSNERDREREREHKSCTRFVPSPARRGVRVRRAESWRSCAARDHKSACTRPPGGWGSGGLVMFEDRMCPGRADTRRRTTHDGGRHRCMRVRNKCAYSFNHNISIYCAPAEPEPELSMAR